MDPYLEPNWRDVHTAFIGEARRALNQILPDGLVARAEERVTIGADEADARGLDPDVRVFAASAPTPAAEAAIAIEAPFKLLLEEDPFVERYIRVTDKDGHLLTVLEFVSPWNKRQPNLDEFRERRASLLSGGVHFIEIDLVRSGNWHALMRPEVCPQGGSSVYRAVVRTGAPSPAGYLFPIALQQKLPDIPIPLRRSDVPAKLPLQSMLEAVYSDGRYDRTLDYSQPLSPRLSDEDATWIRNVLVTAGRAGST